MEQDEEKPSFEEVVQNANQKARQRDIDKQEEAEKKARELAKKNDNFYMLFKDGGSQKVRELINISPPAAQIFMFLAEQADRTNAVVASGKALAKYLNLSEATVSRALKILSKKEEDKEPYLEILKSGGTNVFVLNPEIVWSAWKTGKDYCLFGNAKILITTDEQDLSVKKRLNFLLEKQLQLPIDENKEN
jgi:DNA-binding transcriptional regulator YdaS (Cro superfamily)